MRIQQVSDLSGLSRAQINLLISRHGLAGHSRLLRNAPTEGGARDFTPADAFAFCVGGRAAGIGCDMATIRDIIVALPMPAVDWATFRQREIFDGYRRDEDVMLVVAQMADGTLEAHFVKPDRVQYAVKKATAALVFPASQIARAIEDAGND